MKGSVYHSFLKKFLPLCVSIFIVLLIVSEWVKYEHEKNRLNDKLELLSSTYSLILAEPLYNETDELGIYIISLISEPDISSILIEDSNNEILEQYGKQEKVNSPSAINRQRINYADESGLQVLGYLTLYSSDERIIKEMQARVLYQIVLFSMLILFVLIVAKIAYHYSIGKPLKLLVNAINLFKKEFQHIDVEVTSKDELGIVIASYNKMQSSRIVTELALQNHKNLLEKHVDERTEDLEQEISKHKETSQKLYVEQQRTEMILQTMTDAVFSIDLHGGISYMNPAAEKLTGYTNVSSHLKNIDAILYLENPENKKHISNIISINLDSSQKPDYISEAKIINQSSKDCYVEVFRSTLNGFNNEIIGASIVLRDITNSRKWAKKISYQATHDSLTGLINRRQFDKSLNQIIEETDRLDGTHIFCYIDLDHFKNVNDTSGHLAGDELLRRVSDELKKHLRKDDIFGRLGGDEFGLIIKNCNNVQAIKIVEKMKKAVNNMKFIWGDSTFQIGLSAGTTEICRNSGSIKAIFARADSACYQSKKAGRNKIHIFENISKK